MTDQQIVDALKLVASSFNSQIAIAVERIFRNETAHFKSEGFALSLSPGMEALTQTKPYGWSSLQNYWIAKPEYAPLGIVVEKENSSAMMKSRGDRNFIQFPSIEASMMSVAYLINARGGDPGRWFSNQNTIEGESARANYDSVVNGIIPRFCNSFLNA